MTKLHLVCTCRACPEQYEVYDGSLNIGFIRVRWGQMQVYLGADVIFRRDLPGEVRAAGGFPNEMMRARYLNIACARLLIALGVGCRTSQGTHSVFTIGEVPPMPDERSVFERGVFTQDLYSIRTQSL